MIAISNKTSTKQGQSTENDMINMICPNTKFISKLSVEEIKLFNDHLTHFDTMNKYWLTNKKDEIIDKFIVLFKVIINDEDKEKYCNLEIRLLLKQSEEEYQKKFQYRLSFVEGIHRAFAICLIMEGYTMEIETNFLVVDSNHRQTPNYFYKKSFKCELMSKDTKLYETSFKVTLSKILSIPPSPQDVLHMCLDMFINNCYQSESHPTTEFFSI